MRDTVFLGLNDVVSSFTDGVCGAHGVRNPYMNAGNHGNWDLQKLLEMPDKKYFAPMNFTFWASLEKMPDATLILRFAHSLGHTIFLSSPVPVAGCRDGMNAWVSRNYMSHSLVLCPRGAVRCLAGPDKWLIDDSDSNVEAFTAHGGKAVLVPRPWNSLKDYAFSDDDVLGSMHLQTTFFGGNNDT